MLTIVSMGCLTGKESAFGQMSGNKHKETAQRAPSNQKETWLTNFTLFKQKELYRIQDGAPKIAKLPYKWVYGNYS